MSCRCNSPLATGTMAKHYSAADCRYYGAVQLHRWEPRG